jgi:hypothetical protein
MLLTAVQCPDFLEARFWIAYDLLTTRQLSAWQRGTSFILLPRIPRQCSQVIRSNV